MTVARRLLCVFAHPDDESMGMGSALAHYAAMGVETSLVPATRGERGWSGEPAANPGLTRLGQIREQEARAAANLLGIQQIHFLDYLDGDLAQADPAQAVMRIARHIRQVRPQVVVTFGPEGSYGHPDHEAALGHLQI